MCVCICVYIIYIYIYVCVCVCACVYVCLFFSKLKDSSCMLSHNVEDAMLFRESEFYKNDFYLEAELHFYELQKFFKTKSIYYSYEINSQKITVFTTELLLNESQNRSEGTCPKSYSLCNHYENKCFPSHKRCVFERDMYGEPLHCDDTTHLRFCSYHKCPTHFKCFKSSYCIGLHMVCDGIDDCPDKEDENQCGRSLVKKGLLKCKDDNVYVHPVHWCDGIVNCLSYHDDEVICQSFICPENCVCITYAVYCLGDLYAFQFSKYIRLFYASEIKLKFRLLEVEHLLSLTIENSDLAVVKPYLFTKLPSLLHLKLVGVSNVFMLKGRPFQYLNKVSKFIFQQNHLPELDSSFFFGLVNIECLDLHNVSIKKINHLAFYGLITVKELNISFNDIQYLHTSTFIHVLRLKTLDLRGNEIRMISSREMLFARRIDVYVETGHICCYLKNRECISKDKIVNNECNRILSNKFVLYGCWFIIVFSLIVFLTISHRQLKVIKYSAQNIIFFQNSLIDGLICLSSSYICFMHYLYEDTYPLVKTILRDTWLCYICRTTITTLLVMVFSSPMLTVVVYYRITVDALVKRPFETRAVAKGSGTICFASFMIGLLYMFAKIQIETCFCFPLGNFFISQSSDYILVVLATSVLLSVLVYVVVVIVILSHIHDMRRRLQRQRHSKKKSKTIQKFIFSIMIIVSELFYFLTLMIVSYISKNVLLIWLAYFLFIIIIVANHLFQFTTFYYR